MAPSVGSRGDAYHNALAESVIGLFKTEVIRRQGPWRSLEPGSAAIWMLVVWVAMLLLMVVPYLIRHSPSDEGLAAPHVALRRH